MSGQQIEPWSQGGPSGSSPGTVIRRFNTGYSTSATDITGNDDGGHSGALEAGSAMDALVDAVVERVEQRVIDELERRGRRQGWAAF